MITGMLIAESLRVGATLESLGVTVTRIRRLRVEGNTADQPPIWTFLDFEVDESDAQDLAQKLAAALDEPGWYVDFHSPTESFVIFPGHVFRYQRGDASGRDEARAHARSLDIPESQLDWPE
ncbi:MAG TPA: hypothetical protein QF624_03085 [Dehalococcoidia bacterium]|nr:hypothetical protein [Dehalococcoidia bacterium]